MVLNIAICIYKNMLVYIFRLTEALILPTDLVGWVVENFRNSVGSVPLFFI